MATTQDTESLTNSILMQIDAVMRKNRLHVYPRLHGEFRPLIREMVNEIVAQQAAEAAVEDSRPENYERL